VSGPNPKAPTVREFRAGDLDFIRALAKLAFSEYTPWSGRHTTRMAQRPTSRTFVAEVEGALAGFAIVDFAAPDVATLDAIATDAPHRATGVGRALLERVELEIGSRGVRRLRLVTAEANVAALDLFFKRGFHIEQHKRAFYPRRQNAVVLEKRISAR
jgi:ribosomal protein S18 acetylase RimI-like enzyme